MSENFIKLTREGFEDGSPQVESQAFYKTMGDKGIHVMRTLGWDITQNTNIYGVDAFFPDGKSVEIKIDFRCGCDMPGKKATGNIFWEVRSKGKVSASIRDASDYVCYIIEWGGCTQAALCPRDKVAYEGYQKLYVPHTRNHGYIIPVNDYLRWCQLYGEVRTIACRPD